MKINHHSEITYKPEDSELRWGKTNLKLQFLQTLLNGMTLKTCFKPMECKPSSNLSNFSSVPLISITQLLKNTCHFI
jgi:hypothetical protein